MTTTTKKSKVRPELVARMVKFYGSIEAARDAYRAARTEAKAGGRYGLVLWVAGSGKIIPTSSGDVFYRGSVDAYDVLPD